MRSDPKLRSVKTNVPIVGIRSEYNKLILTKATRKKRKLGTTTTTNISSTRAIVKSLHISSSEQNASGPSWNIRLQDTDPI